MSKANTPSNAQPPLSPIEQRAAELMRQNDDGELDNVFDIVDELAEIGDALPRSSPLRERWDQFAGECEQIMIDNS
jgi:hypothetical protein